MLLIINVIIIIVIIVIMVLEQSGTFQDATLRIYFCHKCSTVRHLAK